VNDAKNQIGRNDPCHCGSGKKYKKCCLVADEDAAQLAREERRKEEEAKITAGPARHDVEPDRTPVKDGDWEMDADVEDIPADEPQVTDRCGSWTDAPLRHYPQPPPIPDATPEVEAVVDAWWQRFKPVYRQRDLDAMHAMMDAFFAEHPDKVPHLHLHQECLLEWQVAMCKAGRRAELADRLLSLRRDFPLVYDQIFQYLDPTLATSLIACGRTEEVSGILDRFTAYPDHDADYLAELLEILLVANRQDDVFALARATAVPGACSSHVIGYGPGVPWLTFEATVPVLERRDASDEAVVALVQAYDALQLPFSHGMAESGARESLTNAFAPLDWSALDERPKRKTLTRLCSHLWIWLHDTQGMSWATAAFFADRLRALYFDNTLGRKVLRDPLAPSETAVQSHICRHCRGIYCLNGVKAFSLLQALWFLADFLVAAGQRTEEQMQPLRATCRNLHGTLVDAVDVSDDGLVLFDTFPEYKFARRR